MAKFTVNSYLIECRSDGLGFQDYSQLVKVGIIELKMVELGLVFFRKEKFHCLVYFKMLQIAPIRSQGEFIHMFCTVSQKQNVGVLLHLLS